MPERLTLLVDCRQLRYSDTVVVARRLLDAVPGVRLVALVREEQLQVWCDWDSCVTAPEQLLSLEATFKE